MGDALCRCPFLSYVQAAVNRVIEKNRTLVKKTTHPLTLTEGGVAGEPTPRKSSIFPQIRGGERGFLGLRPYGHGRKRVLQGRLYRP